MRSALLLPLVFAVARGQRVNTQPTTSTTNTGCCLGCVVRTETDGNLENTECTDPIVRTEYNGTADTTACAAACGVGSDGNPLSHELVTGDFQYSGCFHNHDSTALRLTQSIDNTTYEKCANGSSFGMEWPEGFEDDRAVCW